jgi:hypothetical protein
VSPLKVPKQVTVKDSLGGGRSLCRSRS